MQACLAPCQYLEGYAGHRKGREIGEKCGGREGGANPGWLANQWSLKPSDTT